MKKNSTDSANREWAIAGIGLAIGFLFIYGGRITDIELPMFTIKAAVEEAESKLKEIDALTSEIKKLKNDFSCDISKIKDENQINIKISSKEEKIRNLKLLIDDYYTENSSFSNKEQKINEIKDTIATREKELNDLNDSLHKIQNRPC